MDKWREDDGPVPSRSNLEIRIPVVLQLTVSDNSPENESLLNDREIQILMAFKKVSDTVMGKISTDVEEVAGLSGVEFGVLLRIEELGPAPIRQQGLAESLEWEKSRLSHLFTRMEGRGLAKLFDIPMTFSLVPSMDGTDAALLPGLRNLVPDLIS